MITIPFDTLCGLDSERDEFSILGAGVIWDRSSSRVLKFVLGGMKKCSL